MPDGIGIEMGMTLDDAGDVAQKSLGIVHRLLERTAAVFLRSAHCAHYGPRFPSVTLSNTELAKRSTG